nr:hypothetical protein CFP56_66506 [Quercus suber]
MTSHPEGSGNDANNRPLSEITNDANQSARMKDDSGAQAKQPRYSKIWRWWVAHTGIDARTYKQMFKGALAPTIAIAFYQATAVADEFTTVGYLVGVMAVLSIVIAPRGKFMQTMLLNVLAVCLVCALALLAMYCAIQARISNGGAQAPGTGGIGTSGLATGGAQTAPYSSSGSAVAAVWLFVEIYAISAIRAVRPQFTVPCICAAIFANVSSAYAPQFSTMAQAETFAYHLLTAMLTGFAIASGVSLLVFPLSSREIVFSGMEGYIKVLRAAVKANLDYMHSLEEADIFALRRINTVGEEMPGSKEALALKDQATALTALHAKLSTDLPFAKREVSVGKLGPDDLQALFKLLRLAMIPTVGLSSLSDIFQRTTEDQNWHVPGDATTTEKDKTGGSPQTAKAKSIQEWHQLMSSLREPFGQITAAIDEGLEHIAISLQLASETRQHHADIETGVGQRHPKPGEENFAAHYNQRSLAFLASKRKMLRDWCISHDATPQWMQDGRLDHSHRRLRHQLFVCLFVEFLLFSISRRVYDMILFVESIKISGKLSRNRLIVPGSKRMRKWLIETFARKVEGHGAEQIDLGEKGVAVSLGAGYGLSKDPEHLPPSSKWQRGTNWLREIPRFLASPASSFGFRVAVATLSTCIAGTPNIGSRADSD